jgi:hypothetical protein
LVPLWLITKTIIKKKTFSFSNFDIYIIRKAFSELIIREGFLIYYNYVLNALW